MKKKKRKGLKKMISECSEDILDVQDPARINGNLFCKAVGRFLES